MLAINGAALSQTITFDIATVLVPDNSRDGKVRTEVTATDVWSGVSLGKVTKVNQTVPPHGNIFLTLE